jgi:arylsulfatase A-like enzyme
LFLLADDLGWGDVSYNGGHADTPHLTSMASGVHSIRFNRFYSGAPVCSPTRGTVLTGRNHNRYCVWRANTHSKDCNWTKDFDCPARMPLPPSEVTVAEVLRTAGYRTAAFGKWHLGDLQHIEGGHPLWSPSHPGTHGFDVWKVTERAVPTVNPNCACFDPETCRIGHYRNSVLPACSNYYSNNVSSGCVAPSQPSAPASTNSLLTRRYSPHLPCPIVAHPSAIVGDDSHFILEELTTFIDDSIASSHPFFAYVAFHTPHNRYIADTEYAEKYAGQGLTRKERDYYGSIEALDHAVGQILAHLESLGIRDNTMVWFTSDNGPAASSPGSTNGLEGRKGTLYEGGIRVPGILQWPGVIEQNKVSDYIVSTNDFLPTVMDITGTALPDSRQLDGTSILPHLLGSRTERSSPLNWAFKVDGDFSSKFSAASIQGDLKVHALYKNGRVIQSSLFNVTQDEVTDITSNMPRKCAAMLRELQSWTESLEASAREEVGCLLSEQREP